MSAVSGRGRDTDMSERGSSRAAALVSRGQRGTAFGQPGMVLVHQHLGFGQRAARLVGRWSAEGLPDHHEVPRAEDPLEILVGIRQAPSNRLQADGGEDRRQVGLRVVDPGLEHHDRQSCAPS